jgi:hypothetical protein
MINIETIHTIFAIGLFFLTWELFLKQYFYTKSELAVFIEGRGEGRFTTPTLVFVIIQTTILSAFIIFFHNVNGSSGAIYRNLVSLKGLL